MVSSSWSPSIFQLILEIIIIIIININDLSYIQLRLEIYVLIFSIFFVLVFCNSTDNNDDYNSSDIVNLRILIDRYGYMLQGFFICCFFFTPKKKRSLSIGLCLFCLLYTVPRPIMLLKFFLYFPFVFLLFSLNCFFKEKKIFWSKLIIILG